MLLLITTLQHLYSSPCLLPGSLFRGFSIGYVGLACPALVPRPPAPEGWDKDIGVNNGTLHMIIMILITATHLHCTVLGMFSCIFLR